jgi:hypothetical protein
MEEFDMPIELVNDIAICIFKRKKEIYYFTQLTN